MEIQNAHIFGTKKNKIATLPQAQNSNATKPKA